MTTGAIDTQPQKTYIYPPFQNLAAMLPAPLKVQPHSILADKEFAENLAKRVNQDFSFPGFVKVDDDWMVIDFGEVPKKFAREFVKKCPFLNEVHFIETGNRMPLFTIIVHFQKLAAMTDLQIRAATERLKIENELGEAQQKMKKISQEIEKLKRFLSHLEQYPEDYFQREDHLKELLNSQP